MNFVKWKFSKKLVIYLLIFSNLIVSIIVINNQRLVYKTVNQGINFVQNLDGIIAYSDETGNSEWYLRNKSFHLPEDMNLSIDSQYEILKKNDVKYLLWTNEFNRGSSFEDPVNNTNYTLLKSYSQPIIDPFDLLLQEIGIVNPENVMVYSTKVYQVN